MAEIWVYDCLSPSTSSVYDQLLAFLCCFLRTCLIKLLFILCVHLCAGSTRVEVRGQLTGVCSLFPPCGSWGSNSGCQAWWKRLFTYRAVLLALPLWLYLTLMTSEKNLFPNTEFKNTNVQPITDTRNYEVSLSSWIGVYKMLTTPRP